MENNKFDSCTELWFSIQFLRYKKWIGIKTNSDKMHVCPFPKGWPNPNGVTSGIHARRHWYPEWISTFERRIKTRSVIAGGGQVRQTWWWKGRPTRTRPRSMWRSDQGQNSTAKRRAHVHLSIGPRYGRKWGARGKHRQTTRTNDRITCRRVPSGCCHGHRPSGRRRRRRSNGRVKMTPTRAKAGRDRDDAQRKTKRAITKTRRFGEKAEENERDDLPSDGRETIVPVRRTGRVT